MEQSLDRKYIIIGLSVLCIAIAGFLYVYFYGTGLNRAVSPGQRTEEETQKLMESVTAPLNIRPSDAELKSVTSPSASKNVTPRQTSPGPIDPSILNSLSAPK